MLEKRERNNVYANNNEKVIFTLFKATKPQRGSRCIALLSL
jgi:hypothetical protein